MKTKIAVFALVIACVFAALGAESLSSVLPGLSEKDLRSLLEGREIASDTLNGNSILRLAPERSMALEQALECQKSKDSFSVSSAALIPYPDKWQSLDKNRRQLEIFNTIRKISTQKGITYISHRAGEKPKTLFAESFFIADPKDKKSRIPDPVAQTLPESVKNYAFQKDTSFGANIYEHEYEISEDEIFVKITNRTPMKALGVFKAVDEGKLNIFLETYQVDEGIYVLATARISGMKPIVTVLFVTVDLPSAFRRRITAIREWFASEVSLADRP